MSLHEFFNMSGYGPYVWSCYALTLAVLVGIGVNTRRQLQSEVVRAKRRARVAESPRASENSTAENPMAEHKS